jgi:hypothetical protein
MLPSFLADAMFSPYRTHDRSVQVTVMYSPTPTNASPVSLRAQIST